MSYQIIPLGHHSSDLTLKVVDKFVVIAPVGTGNRNLHIWVCVCHCGSVFTLSSRQIMHKKPRSCGCLGGAASTHGMSHTKVFRIWAGMINRCTKPNNTNFIHYGGRGITVCDEWKTSFEAFYRDMGDPPKGKTLDRINNDGHYSKENCRWVDRKEQSNNTRQNNLVTYLGNTQTITQWAETLGIHVNTLRHRIKKWPNIDDVFCSPVMPRGRGAYRALR